MSDRRTSFNPYVHGARGLFCAMVYFFHVVNSGLPTFDFLTGSALYFFNSFRFGVELFFGISGIVIIGALPRAATLRAFVWDRITRILPVLWATLICITAMTLIAGGWLPSLSDWFLNFIAPPPFLNTPMLNPAAWSLGYEFTFYGLCALAWAMRRAGWPLWGWIIAVPAAALMACYPRSILMMAGVLIATGYLNRPIVRKLAAAPFLWLIIYLVCWRWLDLKGGTTVTNLSPLQLPLGDWLAVLPLLLIVSAFGTLALFGVAEGRGSARLLRLPVMQWMGTISYSFYLWHPVVMAVVKKGLSMAGVFDQTGVFSQLIFAIIALPPSLAVAHYSQRWLEVAVTRWLRGIGPSKPKAPVTAVATEGLTPKVEVATASTQSK